jgi:RimJ/RimL family protein N-acetyltransferase
LSVTGLRVEHSFDATETLDRCRSFLESKPAEHNVLLTLLHDRIETGTEGRYWWVVGGAGGEHGGVVGVCMQTPFTMVPGTSGMSADALDVLVPASPGWMRGSWWRIGRGFGRDTGTSDRHDLSTARRHLEARRLYVWDLDGRPVSMVTRTIAVAGTARISFVYTPPEHRCRGYAGACTAAVSQRCFDTDASSCVLYTQLSNPTSNSVYQRIGYEPVMEVLRFRLG